MIFFKATFLQLIFVFLVKGETQLDLVLSARNLPSTDPFDGDPDSYVILWYSPTSTDNFFQLGQTKYISDNRNPDWPELFRQYVQYCETCTQRIKADIWDEDFDSNDIIGTVTMKVSDLVKAGIGHDGILTVNIPGTGADLIFRINVNRTLSESSPKPNYVYYENNN